MAVHIPEETPAILSEVRSLADHMTSVMTKLFLDGKLRINPIGVRAVEGKIIVSSKTKNILDTFITHTGTYWNKIRPGCRAFFLEHAEAILHGAPSGLDEKFREVFACKDSEGNYRIDVEIPLQHFHRIAMICMNYLCRTRDPRRKEFKLIAPWY